MTRGERGRERATEGHRLGERECGSERETDWEREREQLFAGLQDEMSRCFIRTQPSLKFIPPRFSLSF